MSRFVGVDVVEKGLSREELPPLKDDEVLVRTRVSAPSVGTESAVLAGHGWAGNKLGYMTVGTVEKVGSKVTAFKPGQRWHFVSPHEEYHIRREADLGAYAVPPTVSDSGAVFATLGAIALHIVERAAIALGQTVVVIGLGAVGQLAGQFARRAGAGTIIGIDLDEKRRHRAKSLFADVVVAPEKSEIEAAIAAAGPDAPPPVFLEITGAVPAVRIALETAPLRSRIVLAGTYMSEISFNPFVFIERELEMVGAHQPKCPQERGPYYPYSRQFNYDFFFSGVAAGWLKVAPLVDGTLKLDQVAGWYKAMKNNQPRLGQPVFDWMAT